ncbi:MAG: hypothetical protein GY811_08885 [Myxococcales bacterium]|nr:hypothetical protein [Myxococcales bacterium]
MFDRDDLPTLPYPALAPEPTRVELRPLDFASGASLATNIEEHTVEDFEPPTRVLSIKLPVSAQEAFDAFCESGRVHEWMAVVRSSRVISRAACGRPQRTAFIAQLERSSMGCTMNYEYDNEILSVRWCNGPHNFDANLGCRTIHASRPRFLHDALRAGFGERQ